MNRYFRPAALALLLASPTMPGAIQTAAFAQSEPRTEAPATPTPTMPVLTPRSPVAPPMAHVWQPRAAEALLEYVEGIGKEGLDPAAYQPERIRTALAQGDPGALTSVANQIFLRLSADLSGGYVRGDGRVDWHMPDSALDGNRQQLLLSQASQGDVARLLDSLLPTHPQYTGLREALARTPESDEARRHLIRANMERWRWMPRNLGPRHVIVNVPAFTAAIVEDGRVIARHRTVVGARRTPTPQLMANAVAVTFNPWWNVPQSIVREMGGSFGGYQVRRGDDGKVYVRQPPGPRNALGRLKIEMPNDHAIFLHDTPAQNLFARPVRAFSHGCIRTQNVRDFAALLLGPTGQWDRAEIDETIATGETTRADFVEPVPVYIAYFTAAATTDGDIVTYADIYGRDAPVRQALNSATTGGVQTAASEEAAP
ncbi:L,D-transpeptidase family protein [Sphingosinicella sp. CPCC 101087]|uniref:L,D-transpeptidase family protein n=1 Tax=Sphingosinicella sp. CPCC 101087 TaxID=2497754 RepID=UPI00101B6CDB|nr:L,D-transpeptidase family protein [Sphingosinicella sp. CPCC 101087]